VFRFSCLSSLSFGRWYRLEMGDFTGKDPVREGGREKAKSILQGRTRFRVRRTPFKRSTSILKLDSMGKKTKKKKNGKDDRGRLVGASGRKENVDWLGG